MLDNKNIQRVFGLSDFRKKQLLGEVPERTRESYREYGYFGGGDSAITSFERTDYSNDTSTGRIRGNFPTTARRSGATSNSNFGYFSAGQISIISPGGDGNTSIYRIQYSNDTTSSTRGNFLKGKFRSAATGNNNFGYYAGGEIYADIANYTYVERLDYSNDLALASFRGPLTAGKKYHAGTSNNNFGYFGGGSGATSTSIIVNRINYSNDTTLASIRGSLSAGLNGTSATGNNNFGYFAGAATTRLERINYSNDTVQSTARNLFTITKLTAAATGNSNFGYFSAGIIPGPTTTLQSTVERIDYSNDTATASVRGPLSTQRYVHAATSSASFGGAPNSSFASDFTFPTVPNAGYFGGGTDGTNNLATIDKVDYANDTATASVRSALSVAKNGVAGTGNGSFGYFGGGLVPGPTLYSTVDRLEYASDTQNTITRGPLSVARGFLSATGNSNFGYFVGGGTVGGPYRTTIDRIDYSNDSTTASVRGPLSIVVYNSQAATGNNNFGYFGAGSVPGVNSRIHRIDYANDLLNAEVRTSLSSVRFRLAATGNSNFGYFGGGNPGPLSTVDRIDYSNDTTTASIRGPLSSAKGYAAATGNQNFGYFGGGETPSIISTTDRINYSNDTAVASIRGPLSTAKSALAATSPLGYGGAPIYFTNPLPEVLQKQIEFNDSNTLDLPFKRVLGSYGYFGGGGGGLVSRVDRIDYSNDLTTASIRGPLSLNRYQFSATGNSNFGYYIAGNIASPSVVVTSIDRVDYSNDGATALLRGNTTSGSFGRSFGATGNSNFGYIGNWSYVSTTNRIDYSNDNSTASIRGPLSSAKGYVAATGTQNFGYFGGGVVFLPGPIFYSIVDRIDYSNDLSRSSVRGPLSLARWSLAASGNSNFGYFGGGGTPGSISTVDRIDYSNDTQTASVRGPLSSVRYFLSATGNSNFGYFGGGAPGPRSTIDRINYSNDTATASVRGPLSLARQQLAATTNARNS